MKSQNIEVEFSDSGFQKLLATFLHHTWKHQAAGLKTADAIATAVEEVLLRIRAHESNDEPLQLGFFSGDEGSLPSEADARLFALGLIAGGIFQANGLSFSAKQNAEDIQ